MHYKEVCQFGYMHGQCRCPDPQKTIKYVICNNDEHEKEYVASAGE